MSHEWAHHKPLSRPDGKVEPGEEFEPSEDEQRAFGDFLQEVESDAGGDESDAEEDEVDAEPDTCTAVKSDGEVCGRELPCPYHSED